MTEFSERRESADGADAGAAAAVPLSDCPTPQLPAPDLPAPDLPAPQLPAPQLPRPQLPAPDAQALAGLAALGDAVTALASVDPGDLNGPTVLALFEGLEFVNRRLDGLRARLLPVIDADGRWALDGSRSLAAWLRCSTGASGHESWRQVRTARALRDHLPLTARALDDGAISGEHARLLAQTTTKTPERITALAHPQVGEEFLVQQAQRLDAGDFAKVLRAWAIAADPGGADAAYAEDADRQEFVLANVLRGYHLQGWLDDADGAVLDAALNAVIGIPDAGDGKSMAQRRAAALVTLARMALDSGALTPGAAIRPHLNVHVPLDTLVALAEASGTPPARSAVVPVDAFVALAEAQAPTAGEGEDSCASPKDCLAHRGADGTATGAGDDPSTGANGAGGRSPRDDARTAPHHSIGQGSAPPAEPFTEPGRFALPTAAGAALRADVPPRHPGRPGATEGSRSADTDQTVVIPGGLDHRRLVGAIPAELDDHTPVPPALLARLACDSELARVVFGPASEVLDVGRAQRLFPPAQRRAIIARDRRCAFPGCDAPPGLGEIHHCLWWYAQHGATKTANGVLLCWAHHDYVHAHAITITRISAGADHALDPGWVFTRPGGSVITARRHSSRHERAA